MSAAALPPPPSSCLVPEEIKLSLRSVDTTTSLTLSLVRALLGVDECSSAFDGASKPASTASTAATTSTGLTVATTSKTSRPSKTTSAAKASKAVAPKRAITKRLPFHIHNANQPPKGPLLSAGDRRRAAAEIINTTLKAISAAAKARQTTALQQVKEPVRASSPQKTIQPLQEHVPNRLSKPDRKACSREPINIEYLVQCAETALDCLRQPVGENSESPFDLGTENAALAIVDKCLLFHLNSHAEAQLCKIHDQYWKRRKQAPILPKSAKLYQCLIVCEEDNAKVFKFATSLQSQCLRLILLADGQTIDQECIKALHPDRQGSPAQVLQAGQRHGHLSADTCAGQLRTMALAVSKIYARAAQAPRAWTANSPVLLSLSLISLHLKSLCWGSLGSLPDLQQELWTPLGRSIKQYLAHCREPKRNAIERYMQALWTTLQRLQALDVIPADTLKLIQHLSPSIRCSKSQSISPLCSAGGGVNDTSATLLPRLKDAVNVISSQETAPAQCLVAMKSALSTLGRPKCPEKKHLTDFLVQSAHLRKAAMATIARSSSSKSSEGSVDVNGELQRHAALVIYALLHFFTSTLEALKPGAESTILLTLAKTVESVTSLEQYSFVKAEDMVAKSRASLLMCLQLCNLLALSAEKNKDTSVWQFFHSLPLRISQYFWSRYRHFTERRRPVEARLEALNDSIDILQKLNPATQKSGHLVVNYEELSRVFTEQKEYTKAQQCLSSAIKHQILQGHLSRAAEHALHNTQGQLWDVSDSSIHSLGRNLAKYIELSFHLKEHTFVYFDQEQLSGLHRAVLLERQITAILTSPIQSFSSQQIRSGIHSVLDHTLQPAHCHYRLRFISHILRLLERSNLLASEEVLDDQTMVVAPVQAPSKRRTPPPASSLLAITVRIQWAFACGNMDEAFLKRLAAEFSQALDETGSQWQNTLHTPDIKICMAQLRALSDFAEMLGSSEIQLSVLDSLSRLHSLSTDADPAQHAIDLSQRALLLTREGETAQAGELFLLTQRLIKDTAVTDYVASTLLLDHAEHLLGIGKSAECSDILGLVDNRLAKMECPSSREGCASKLEKESIKCRRALVASKLAFCQGLLIDAFVNARQAARLSTMLWTAIEKAWVDKAPRKNDAVSDSTIQGLADEVSAMSLQGHKEPRPNAHRRAHWTQISLHRDALMHVGAVAAHCGLYLDAVFYYRQAAQTADHTAGKAYKTRVESELALIYAGAQNDAMAKAAMAEIITPLPEAVLSVEQCHTILNLSEAFWLLGDEAQARESIERALAFARNHKTRVTAPELAAPPVTAAKKTVKRAASTRRPISRTKPKEKERAQAPVGKASILNLAQRLLHARLEALQYEMAQSSEGALLAISETSKAPNVAIARALQLIEQAKAFFASDPAHSSLAETALAFPVRYRPGRKSGQMSVLLEDAQRSPKKAEASQKTSRSMAYQYQPFDQPDNQGCRLLADAYAYIKDLERGTQELGELSSSQVHVLHKTLSKLHLLSTALAPPLAYSPLPIVLQSLIPKDIARSREQIAIAAEARGNRAEITAAEPLDDVAEFVNALPSTWRIVSIGVSQDQNELILSKTSTGASPFLIRVPLARTGFDDLESHDFTLESAHEQLADIIARADANTHDPRGQADKATRKEWYAEREALDEEMGFLLQNMENLWLGGFKGLLSPYMTDTSLLARFGQSLNQALDKHLPSRQKASKRGSTKFDLHARVLELFVSMKLEETAEFEDAITDLLYFVVDTLNFNGEPNAVDEIDFDELLVDVLDSLKAYHHAAEASVDNQTVHTILILDKELHSFPWESLPCLRGQAVYRMPCLGAVKERLDELGRQSPEGGEVTVQRTSGAYILNPSQDLTSTQETYASTLEQQLSRFTAIVNRAPTEEEFKASLSNHDILLYFGHGSGGQYIRGRSIRGLKTEGKRCAVSWLMGCSSVKMTTCGIYEPYGMPWHYINGGAHAVVGTLWDVTDREIDRFAMKALTEWGLLDETEETSKVTERGKGKGKRRMSPSGSEAKKTKAKSKTAAASATTPAKAIGEAVAIARETCFLKYLSGAAPVVYGIPVCVQ